MLAVALGLAALTVPAGAEAQRRSYRRVVREAVAEFSAERYAEARALFEEAHGMRPGGRTLRGIALCAFHLGEYVEAAEIAQRALVASVHPLTARQQVEIQRMIADAQRFVGRFEITVEPDAAALTVDDQEPVLEPDGTVALPLGEHLIEATLDGFHDARRRLTVRGGERETIALELRPIGPPGPPPSTGPPAVPLGLLIGGGGALLLDVVFVGWFIDRESELALCDSMPGCTNRPTLSEQRDVLLGLVVGASITAAAAGTLGAVLWVVEDGSPDAAAVRCGPGALAVHCAGRF